MGEIIPVLTVETETRKAEVVRAIDLSSESPLVQLLVRARLQDLQGCLLCRRLLLQFTREQSTSKANFITGNMRRHVRTHQDDPGDIAPSESI